MEYSVNGLELEMRYDVMRFIINNMQRNNFTQKELAQKLKMKDSQLSKILSGENNLTLKTIARFFSLFKKKPVIYEKPTEIFFADNITATIVQTTSPVSVVYS